MKTAKEILKPYIIPYNWAEPLNGEYILTLDESEVESLIEDIDDTLNELRQERDQYKEAWLDDLEDAFTQACWIEQEKQYDHMCQSTYEYMQRELIKHGRIQFHECYRR